MITSCGRAPFFLLVLKASCVLFLFSNDWVKGDVNLSCSNGKHCLDQLVEYQCRVNGSGINVLTWKIYRDNGTQFGSDDVYVSFTTQDPTETGVFRAEKLSESPLISNISFTVQSSINGYTIVCEDNVLNCSENCSINIQGSPSLPRSITTNVTATIIRVSWTPPSYSSQCVSSYSVHSNATDSTITTTIDTSVDIPLAGLSPGVYCVSVATVDIANRTGNYTDEECVESNVPSQPVVTNSTISETSVVILWSFPESIIPPLSAVYIEYASSSGAGQSLLIPLVSSNEYNYTILRDNTATVDYYNITVFGRNILGNGSTTSIILSMPLPTPSSSFIMGSTCSSPSTMGSTMGHSITPSMSGTPPTSPANSRPGTDAVVIAVPIVVILLVVLVVITILIILYFIRRKNSREYEMNPWFLQPWNKYLQGIKPICCGCCASCYRGTANQGQADVAPAQLTEVELKTNSSLDANEEKFTYNATITKEDMPAMHYRF